MKKPLFLLCALAFLVFACDKTEDDEPIDENSVLLLETVSINYGDSYGGEGEDELMYKYEYDAQNRLVKINEYNDGVLNKSSYTVLTYNDAGDLTSYKEYGGGNVTWEITCQKNGNTVTCTEKDGSHTYNYTLNLGNNGLPTTMTTASSSLGYGSYFCTETYTYDSNNNIKKIIEEEDYYDTTTSETNYTYDNKKCPWYSCNTSKWIWYVLCFYHSEGAEDAYLYNNFTKIEGGGATPWVVSSFTYEYNAAEYPERMTKNRVEYLNGVPGSSYGKEIKYTYKKAN